MAGGAVVLVLGQVWLRYATAGLTHQTATTLWAVAPLVLGLGGMTGLFLIAATRLGRVDATRGAVAMVLVAGLAMRLVWLGAPAPLEDDYKRYLWDGAVVAHGLDPYRHPPATFGAGRQVPAGYEAVAAAGQETARAANFPELRTIYPSVAQAAFALAHILAPFDVDGLRAVFIAAELTGAMAAMAVLGALGASPLWAALYWCNPTMVYTLVAIAHVDALLPVLVLGALLASMRGRTMVAAGLIAAGAGVKIWPLLLAPLVLWRARHQPMRMLAAASVLAAALAVATGPLLLSALEPASGLAAYSAHWSNNNAIYAWTAWGTNALFGETGQRGLRLFLALTAGGIAVWLALRDDRTARGLAGSFLAIAALTFYLSPAEFPWYTAWFLPLAAVVRNWPLLLASALIPVYYLFFPLWAAQQGDLFFFGVGFLHALPVLGWLAFERQRERT
jgi:hypothetical protein